MPGGQIKVTQKGAISLNSIRLAVDASQLKSNKITWKGQTDYISSRHDGVSIKLNGDISLHDTQVASETTQITAKAFHWKGKTNYKDSSDNTINLKLSGDLGLIKSKLFLPGEALEIEQGKLTWSGNSDISIPANSAGTLIANGKTSSEQFRLFASQRDADVQYEKLTWDGGIDLNLESGLNNLMANGHVAVQSFQATAPNANYVLMAFEHLDVDKFKVKLPQDTSSERLEFAGLMLGKQQPTEDVAQEPEALSLVHYGKLTLDKLQYSEDDGLAIHIIRQTDATQMVRHRSDGKWNAVRLIDIMESAAKGKAQDVTPAAQEKSLRIVVDKIIVDGNSKIIFEDLQPNPRFRQELKVENARLEKLDTNIPDQASPLELNGVFVPHAKVTLSGVVSPFAERLTLDIKGNVNGLPLPPLSSYSKKLLGYTLDSGELDADITLKANNGQLAGENKLNLHQLEVTPLPPDNKKDVEAKLDVPLETGLAMLRDKNNNIQLSMPLTGDVDNFELDPSDAINQVVGKAMKTAAKSYLSAALFPYGTLLTVAQLAGEQVMKVNLDPVFYTPGSTRLGTKDKEYLGKVATILSERPEIHVKLCGIATETDRAHLIEKNKENTDEKKQEQQNSTIDEQLKLLAQNRAEIIEKYLVEEHDTKANRLISCQPSIEKEDAQAKPRTELSL
ncbi:MAG: DUF748 domain-containing protein [Gammaproteobacteria bacterium]|nr:MAG: DUF748 domain-containing protein [Gammaproteobacteria bacterium]